MKAETAAKLDALRQALGKLDHAVVAFSGGVDSTLLLRVAHDVLGERAVALTTVSPTNPEEDTGDALAFANDLGIEHIVVHADELEIPGYRENPTNRCYFCKTNLYEIAEAKASERGLECILDGVNTDDLGDYRPGLKAAAERDVLHPLAEVGLDKAGVREISRELGLSTWDRPSSPCLSSRFPYGTEITLEGLERVARGERFLREAGFPTCRVRYHGDVARLEVPAGELAQLAAEPLRGQLVAHFRSLGFNFVALDLEGFKSGALNRGL